MGRFVNICTNERIEPIVCDAGDLDLKVDDFCVINHNGHEETGFVRSYAYDAPSPSESEEPDKGTEAEPLPRVLRRATSHEVRSWHFIRRREEEAMAICKEKAAKHGLEMKISNVELDDRQRKVVFYFTADKRVDFRELVKDLASTFRARIELWQIGVRDEAKRMSGIGICGCALCCAMWMREFAPVSIRCAKAQDLQFSPARLSGICGRLRCCLSYEHEQYVDMGKDFPTVGAIVDTEKHGEGRVVERNLLKQTLTITDAKGQSHSISLSDVKRVAKRTNGEKEGESEWIARSEEDSREAASLLSESDEDTAATAPGRERSEPRRSESRRRERTMETESESRRDEARSFAPAQGTSAPQTGTEKEKNRSHRRRRGRRRPEGAQAERGVAQQGGGGTSRPSQEDAGDTRGAGGNEGRRSRRGHRSNRRGRRSGKPGGQGQDSQKPASS